MADKINEGSGEKKEASKSSTSGNTPAKSSSDVPGQTETNPAEKQTGLAASKTASSGEQSDDQKKKEKPAGAASSRLNRSWMAIGITLGVLIALAAILFGGPWAKDTADDLSVRLNSQIDDLEKRVSVVEKAISVVPKQSDEPARTEQTLASLRKALEGLEKRVEAMSTRSANEVPMTNPQSPAQSMDDAKLGAALDLIVALEERVATLESGNGAIPDIPFNVTERLIRLEKVINSGLLDRISSLEEVVPDTASHEDLRDVEKRLFKLENKKSDPKVARAAQSMAAASLSRAVLSARPFEVELDLVENLYPGTDAAQVLRRHAATGLEPQQVILADFESLALQALRDARQAAADDWSSRVWAWTQSFITIRRTGADQGDDMEAVINRIEGFVVKGNFAEALAESEKLEADVLDPWRERLKVRVEAEDALRNLSALASQSAMGDQ